MPRRDDLESILLVGSGPIVIGQASEFDYSGTQACRVLKEEGYRVVLVNSNPATIMTDPVALLLQHPARLGARVVELGGQADDDGHRADQEDRLEVLPARH